MLKILLKTIYRRLFCGKLYYFERRFAKEQQNDMRYLDKEIEDYALKITPVNFEKKISNNKIALLATELYDFGGHTEVIKNVVKSIANKCSCKLFLAKKHGSLRCAPVKIKNIQQYSEIDGVNLGYANDKKILLKMFSKITAFAPKAIFVFIHNNDVFCTALLALLKKHTDIKIFYFDLGSHQFSIGMSFADLILEGMPSTAFITQKYRGFKNTNVSWLCYLQKEKLPDFTESQILAAKKKIGLPSSAISTLSGATSYKFFTENESPYLEMIKRLLEKHENLYHVLITELNPRQKLILNSIFEKSHAKSRIIVMNFTTDFKLFFKCADVFIDSFPVSSALTMVDLMSLHVPFAAKINKDNPAFSFHEYLTPNYPYMFCEIDDFEKGINELLLNAELRKKIAEMNFEHFLNVFEGTKYASRIIDLVNCEDLSKVYDKEIDGEQYKDFGEIKLLTFPHGFAC
jgi:hypothetical protein